MYVAGRESPAVSRWLGRDFLPRRATESKQTTNMEVEIQMDDELDNELFYYGEVCELFDETVEAEFSGFVEDDDEVLEVESEDEILDPLLLPTSKDRSCFRRLGYK